MAHLFSRWAVCGCGVPAGAGSSASCCLCLPCFLPMLGIVTWSHLWRFTQPRVIAGSAGLVRLATRCLNVTTTTVKRTMGLLKERGLVESVQGIAGNKNHGRVLGRCFCGGGRFHSRRVMRPVKIRMTVLIGAGQLRPAGGRIFGDPAVAAGASPVPDRGTAAIQAGAIRSGARGVRAGLAVVFAAQLSVSLWAAIRLASAVRRRKPARSSSSLSSYSEQIWSIAVFIPESTR